MVHTFVTGFLVTSNSHERIHTLIRRLFALWMRFYVADQADQNNGECVLLQQFTIIDTLQASNAMSQTSPLRMV